MSGRGVSTAIVSVVGCLLLPTTASAAAFTGSTITSPQSGFIGPLPSSVSTFIVTGSVTGGLTGDPVHIDCVYLDSDGNITGAAIGSGSVAADGSFSVSSDATAATGQPCHLIALPTDTVPSNISAFHGPDVFALVTGDTTQSGGPNNGKAYDYDDTISQPRAHNEYRSTAACGLYQTNVFSPTADAQGLYQESRPTFDCNGGLFGTVSTSPGTYRSGVRVDGEDAFFADAAQTILPNGAWPGLQHTVSYDRAGDTLTITEIDSPVECPANNTTTTTTSADCAAFSDSGVTLKRVYTTDHHGLVTRQTDTWTSSGPAHSIDLLELQQFGTGLHSGFRFPGETSFATHAGGDTVTIPPSATPATIQFEGDTTAPSEGPNNPQASTTVWPLPDTATFDGSASYYLHYAFTIPANGSYTITKVYASELTQAALGPLTTGAQDALAAPVVDVTSPAEGATVASASLTVTGTASDNVGVASLKVNGADVTLGNGAFSAPVTLTEGPNTITVVATDAAGNTTTVTRHVTYTPPTPTTPTTTTPTPPPTPTPTIAVTGKPKLIVRHNSYTVDVGETVNCPAGGPACSASAVLATVKRFALSKKARKAIVRLGSKRTTLAPGRLLKVHLKLSSKAVRLLKKHKRLKVRATIGAASSAGAASAKRTLTIRAPRARKHAA